MVQKQLEEKEKKDRLAKLEEEKKLLGALFNAVVEQKVEKGVDPKSVLCTLFVKNACTRGMAHAV